VSILYTDEGSNIPAFFDFALEWADDAADDACMLRLDIPRTGESKDEAGAGAGRMAGNLCSGPTGIFQ
jgi:hypothetical protein